MVVPTSIRTSQQKETVLFSFKKNPKTPEKKPQKNAAGTPQS